MTVAAIIPRNDYIGTGLVDTYAYGFKIVDQTDLLVIVADEDGVETVMDLGTDYTVTDVGNINGGTIVFSGNLADGYALTILQNAPIEQETSIRNDSRYYASIHEDTFDTGRRIDQQLEEQLQRTLQFKRTSLTTGVYIDDVQDDSVLLSNSDSTSVGWAPRASFIGPTGATGPTGPAGAPGIVSSISDTGTINLTDSAGDLTADIITGSITNDLINASAAIALTKLAATTASRALVSDGSGVITPATTTATEIGYVNGVTSAIQTQLNGTVKTTGDQTITGLKEFDGGVSIDAGFRFAFTSDASTGVLNPMTLPATVGARFIGAVTQITTIESPTNYRGLLLITNGSGADITIKNSASSSEGEIYTGTGADITLSANATLFLYFNTSNFLWHVIGGSGSGGSQNATFTGTTVTATAAVAQKFRYTGGSAQTLSALTFSSLPDGGRIIITGSSDTNTLTIPVGLTNVQMNGEKVLTQYSSIEFIKDDTQLIQVGM